MDADIMNEEIIKRKETFFFPDYHIGLCRRYFTGGAAFNAAYSHKGKSGDAFS